MPDKMPGVYSSYYSSLIIQFLFLYVKGILEIFYAPAVIAKVRADLNIEKAKNRAYGLNRKV